MEENDEVNDWGNQPEDNEQPEQQEYNEVEEPQQEQEEEEEQPKTWREARKANVKQAQARKASYQRSRKMKNNIDEYKASGVYPEPEDDLQVEEIKVTKKKKPVKPKQEMSYQPSHYEKMLMDKLMIAEARNKEYEKKQTRKPRKKQDYEEDYVSDNDNNEPPQYQQRHVQEVQQEPEPQQMQPEPPKEVDYMSYLGNHQAFF